MRLVASQLQTPHYTQPSNLSRGKFIYLHFPSNRARITDMKTVTESVQRNRRARVKGGRRNFNCKLSHEAFEKASKMAGYDSLGWLVEELIVREWRRRERRMDGITIDDSSSSEAPIVA